MVAQIGNCAEARIVDQISAQIIAQAFEKRRKYKRDGHYIPVIMDMQEMGDDASQVEVPPAIGKAEKDGAFGRVGPENLIEYRLQKEDTKSVEYSDEGRQHDSGQPLQRIWQPVAQQAQESTHAARPALRAQRVDGC